MDFFLRSPENRDRLYVHPFTEILCAGTSLGSVAMWKYEPSPLKEEEYIRDPEKDWKLQNPTIISGAIKQVNVILTSFV